jgi:hypothetical protein
MANEAQHTFGQLVPFFYTGLFFAFLVIWKVSSIFFRHLIEDGALKKDFPLRLAVAVVGGYLLFAFGSILSSDLQSSIQSPPVEPKLVSAATLPILYVFRVFSMCLPLLVVITMLTRRVKLSALIALINILFLIFHGSAKESLAKPLVKITARLSYPRSTQRGAELLVSKYNEFDFIVLNLNEANVINDYKKGIRHPTPKPIVTKVYSANTEHIIPLEEKAYVICLRGYKELVSVDCWEHNFAKQKSLRMLLPAPPDTPSEELFLKNPAFEKMEAFDSWLTLEICENYKEYATDSECTKSLSINLSGQVYLNDGAKLTSIFKFDPAQLTHIQKLMRVLPAQNECPYDSACWIFQGAEPYFRRLCDQSNCGSDKQVILELLNKFSEFK